MKQLMNKILLVMLIILLATFPASAKVCTTTLLYCGDGTNNCNKVTCYDEAVYNGTLIYSPQWNDTPETNNAIVYINYTKKPLIHAIHDLQWQFDYWSFFIGMIVIVLYLYSCHVYYRKH